MLTVDDAPGADHDEGPGAAAGAGEAPRIPSDVFVEVVRVLIVALTTAFGQSVGSGPGAALGACTGYVAGGVLGRGLRRATGRFEARVERTPAVTLVGGAVGALMTGMTGMIIGIVAVVLLPGRWGYPVLGLTAWTGVYAGFQVGARKGAELLGAVRGGGAPVVPVRPRSPLVLVDSSAAIDGRLPALAASGFLPGALAVPRFVLDELQGLADAADPVRRRRARRALESLESLRHGTDGLAVLPDEVPERDTVDAKLIVLSLRLGAPLLTADRGLAAVAAVEGAACLDVTRLADGLRPGLVPGETAVLRISRDGRDPGQGVGFLDDGTMVVVSDAAGRIGDEVVVEVTSSVPTSKGRLYFASIA